MSNYNFKDIEESTLKFWNKNNIYQKAKDKNKGKQKYYFLDGPPYTSGRVHIGTAWNKSLKDMILRYKRMAGFDVWDRAGYDMHGLPTENATQKKLNLKSKHDIEAFGVKKFIDECKILCVENMKVMNDDFIRLGVWMDFEHAYQSITDEFINGEWWLIKKAHENKRLYQGYRALAWDWADETACAKHELEYRSVTDKSIFVKLNTVGNEFLIIWTTTPWTIPMNLGVMVHPELDYVKCKVTHEGKEEIWIVAKGLAGVFLGGVCQLSFQILEEMKGADLEGLSYTHPFHSLLKEHYEKLKKDYPNVHTVVMSEEYVTLSAGTGLVHMAPGCGPEDYEVGHRNNIIAWNPLLPNGLFPKDMGVFAGKHAKHDNDFFIEQLERQNALIAVTEVEHDYPFAQRSKQPVVFRATKQWFLKVEDLKPRLIEENNSITWIPDAAFNAFDSWLKNLRDNSVSKQRYWGTPLPVWMHDDDPEDLIVVGSKEELEKLAGQEIKDLHIPEIDKVIIKKDGKEYRRVPDILDVWVDAGTASWNCLDYPDKKENFKDLFPAEFILEGKDQIRGWFNLLHVASMVSMDRPSFKNCYMHGFIKDAQGRKMSKSLGNYILPGEVVEKYGADTLRFYMIGGANPGQDLNYNFDDANLKHRNLIVLWNLHKFVLDYVKSVKGSKDLVYDDVKDLLGIEEKFMLSKLNSTIKNVTELFNKYYLNNVPWKIEELFLSLSRDYIQMVRDKSSIGSDDEKKVVAYALYTCFIDIMKLLAPVVPFIAEKMYQDFKEQLQLDVESIHLFSWPIADDSLIDAELEESFSYASSLLQSILNAREKAQLGVRWPLSEVVIETSDESVVKAVKVLGDIIKLQTNVKDIRIMDDFPNVKTSLEIEEGEAGKDFKDMLPVVIQKLADADPSEILKALESEGKFVVDAEGKDFEVLQKHISIQREVAKPYVYSESRKSSVFLNTELSSELEAEGYAREITRRVQNARKKAGLSKPDKIKLTITCDEELQEMLEKHKDLLKEKVGAETLALARDESSTAEFVAKEKIKGKEIGIFFDKE